MQQVINKHPDRIHWNPNQKLDCAIDNIYLQYCYDASQSLDQLYELLPKHISKNLFQRHYLNCYTDKFIICNSKPIGLFVANLSSWDTYYLRYVYIQPDYRCQGIFSAILGYVLTTLTEQKIAKVEASTSPNNFKMIDRLNHLRFFATGYQVSESMLSLVMFRKYLQTKMENEFIRNFCSNPDVGVYHE